MFAKTCFDEWEAAKQSAVAGDFQANALSRIASTLSEAYASKRREGMGNLREKALERISKRQTASHFHFEVPALQPVQDDGAPAAVPAEGAAEGAGVAAVVEEVPAVLEEVPAADGYVLFGDA